ncbi:hypothetical protein CHCC20335_2545 [Bacillus paralicheniformis]|nr:hypothetical protein CHCC20335_2545 [Bacillus paralicheniformis]GIN66818.1 hypothetical protein J41TS2_22390 [Bacillus sonorensis]
MIVLFEKRFNVSIFFLDPKEGVLHSALFLLQGFGLILKGEIF